MAEVILALNAGSSSIKFAVYEARTPELVLLFKGVLDHHAGDNRFVIKDVDGKHVPDDALHASAPKSDLATTLLARIERLLGDRKLRAIGHRIVHGGADFLRRS
jgi:acetate kinase